MPSVGAKLLLARKNEATLCGALKFSLFILKKKMEKISVWLHDPLAVFSSYFVNVYNTQGSQSDI